MWLWRGRKRCSERRPVQTGERRGIWTEVLNRRRFSLIETVISTEHVKVFADLPGVL